MRGPKRRDIGHGALAERALAADDPDRGGLPLRDPGRLRHAGVERVLVDGLRLRLLDGPAGRRRAGLRTGRRRRDGPDQGGRRLHRPHRHRRRRGPPRRHGLQGRRAPRRASPPCRWTSRSPASRFEILHGRARAGPARAACSSSTRWPRRSTGPREQLSQFAPRIELIKIDPEKIGALIGKGGETIRGLSEEFEAEIDVDDDGTVRVYAPTGDLVDACVGAHHGDDQGRRDRRPLHGGKVVKTTTFGAFVELAKGTDGLLHISNVKPGERVGAVEDVLNQGDEIDVTVVEVDKERGRIGLRLTDDPDVEGKSAEELAGVGTGDPGPPQPAPRRRRSRWRRAPARARRRRRSSPRAATAAGAAEPAWPSDQASSSPSSTPGIRVVTEAVPSVRSVALGLWVRTGSRDETPAQAGVSHFLEHLLFKGTKRYSAIEIAEIFDGLGAAVNAATGKESTQPLRAVPRHPHRRGLRPARGDAARPDLSRRSTPSARSCSRRSRCTRTSRRTRSTTCSTAAVFGGHPLGRRVLGEARGDQLDPGPRHRRLPPRPLHRRATSWSPPPATSSTTGSSSSPGATSSRPPPAATVRARRAAGRRRHGRLPAEGHRAVPHLLRRSGHRSQRRASLRAQHPRRGLRRLDLIAALPRGPREEGPRLRRRLLHAAVRRQRPDRHLRRHPRGQRPGGLRDHRPRAGLDPHRGHHRRRARACQGARQGPDGALLGVDRRAHGADRQGRSSSTRRCSRSTSCSRRSTRSPPRTSPSSPASSTRRTRSRPPRSPRARSASARRSRRSQKRSPPSAGPQGDRHIRSPHGRPDQGRRLRRRGPHGGDRMRRGRGRRRHGAGRPSRPGARHVGERRPRRAPT